MTYFYSVLRFVPDPARSEFVNIGAVAGSDDTADWTLRLVSNLSRARAIDDSGSLGTALAFLGEIESRIAALDTLPDIGPSRMSRDLVVRWTHEMRNVLQFTAPAPVIAGSADDALDLIFEELVLDPATRHFRFEKKHRAVKATLDSYRRAEIPNDSISQRVRVSSGRFRDDFDFAVHNGAVVQLVRCWSFQLPAQDQLAEEVKAWGWMVEQLREHGGEVGTDGWPLPMPVGVTAHLGVVYVPPLADQEAPAFQEAQDVWRVLDVTAVEPSQSDLIAEAAERGLQSAL